MSHRSTTLWFLMFGAVVALLSIAGCTRPSVTATNAPVASADPDRWAYVWGDEFDRDGLPDSTRWGYAVGGHGWGNNELQYYTAGRRANAEVTGGSLHIRAIREPWEGRDYTSVRLISRGKGDFQYGRFEIRARLPAARGTWPAIWMMPSDWEFSKGGWPDVGEIDIMEHVGHEPGIIHASAHSRDYQWQKGTQKTGTIEIPNATSVFHTYVLEWSAEELRAYVNDHLYFEYENEGLGWTKWPYDKPFYLIMNVAVGGAWGGAAGVDTAAFPQIMEIDYVRVYRAARE